MPADVATAVIAASSAVGGALVVTVGQFFLERMRLDQATTTQDYERRLASAADFISAALEWGTTAKSLASALEASTDTKSIQPLLEESNRRSDDAYARVLLVLSDEAEEWLVHNFADPRRDLIAATAPARISQAGDSEEIRKHAKKVIAAVGDATGRLREDIKR